MNYVFWGVIVIFTLLIIHGLFCGQIYLKGKWYSRKSQSKEYYCSIILYMLLIFMVNLMRNIWKN